jgi:hypothetical protein
MICIAQPSFDNFHAFAQAVPLIPIQSGNATLDRGLPVFYDCLETVVDETSSEQEANYFKKEPRKSEVVECYREVFVSDVNNNGNGNFDTEPNDIDDNDVNNNGNGNFDTEPNDIDSNDNDVNNNGNGNFDTEPNDIDNNDDEIEVMETDGSDEENQEEEEILGESLLTNNIEDR